MSTVTVRPARFLDWLARDRSRAVALLAVAVLLAAGVGVAVVRSGSEGLAAGEARLLPEGQVEISLAGAEFVAASEDTVLKSDDRVRVLGGKAVLELPGGTTAELRVGSHVRLGSTNEPLLKLDRGDLLLQVSGTPVVVDGGSAMLTVDPGAVKLRRSASLLVGTYAGEVLIRGTGRSLAVPALRQAAVAGTGTVPSEDGVRPLTLEEDDEWDRRILGAVLDLDRRLVAFGRGFEALLPGETRGSPALYRQVLPTLADAPLSSTELEARAAGENLIGLTLVALSDGSFEERTAEVFGFRDAGARWGLVAAAQGLDPPAVIEGVEAAIDRAPVEVAAPEEVPGTGGGGGGNGGSSGGGGNGGGGNGGGGNGNGGGGVTTTTGPRTTTTGPGSTTTTTGGGGGGGTTTTTQPTTTTTSPLCDFLPTC